MTEEEKVEKVKEARLAQSRQRFKASQKAEEKAMEIDLERILKQSDIIFTLNGFLLAILIFIISREVYLSILFFVIAIILIFRQSIRLRNIRNKISMTMKGYLNQNAEIVNKNNKDLLEQEIQETQEAINDMQNIIKKNKKELDKIAQESIDITDGLIKKQENRKYISLINFGIILFIVFIKYGIFKMLCNILG